VQLQGTKLSQVTEKLHIPYTVKKVSDCPGEGKIADLFLQ
jgi:hypothetical protein